MNDSFYFQILVKREKIVTVIGLLRSCEDGCCFDRVENPKSGVIECFVPKGMYSRFVFIITLFKEHGFIEHVLQKDLTRSSLYGAYDEDEIIPKI